MLPVLLLLPHLTRACLFLHLTLLPFHLRFCLALLTIHNTHFILQHTYHTGDICFLFFFFFVFLALSSRLRLSARYTESPENDMINMCSRFHICWREELLGTRLLRCFFFCFLIYFFFVGRMEKSINNENEKQLLFNKLFYISTSRKIWNMCASAAVAATVVMVGGGVDNGQNVHTTRDSRKSIFRTFSTIYLCQLQIFYIFFCSFFFRLLFFLAKFFAGQFLQYRIRVIQYAFSIRCGRCLGWPFSIWFEPVFVANARSRAIPAAHNFRKSPHIQFLYLT